MTDSDDEEPVIEDNKLPLSGISSRLKVPIVLPTRSAAALTTTQSKVSPSGFPFQSSSVTKHQNASLLSPILHPANQTFSAGEPHENFLGLEKDDLQGKSYSISRLLLSTLIGFFFLLLAQWLKR